jgi:hypothetical protein
MAVRGKVWDKTLPKREIGWPDKNILFKGYNSAITNKCKEKSELFFVEDGRVSNQQLVQVITCYLSADAFRLFFGLGKVEMVEWIEILWPSATA